MTIYQSFEHLIPDAAELIHTFLIAESDMTCKRNAFVFLLNHATPKAVEYTLSVYDQIGAFDELMQLAIIELVRKDCKTDTVNRVSLLSVIQASMLIASIIATIHSPHLRASERLVSFGQI